ncbi:MAG: 3-deoxy-D-manno-octulosonic acid transferase [Thermodesulfobacteriota bacterium]
MARLIYNIVLHTLVPPFLAAYYLPRIVLGGKYRRSLAGKLGRLPRDFDPERLSRPRIWFHAVSVGEAVALRPMVSALKDLLPNASCVVSTGTETGQDKARELMPDVDGFFYLPLDFPATVNPVVRKVDPDLFVLMETELWPNLVNTLKQSGAAIALANGRISDRSFPRYVRLKPFFSSTLRAIDLFLMSSELDAERIVKMGAAAERVSVTGNTKFDAVLGQTDPDMEARMRALLEIEPETMALIAGSTHPGEDEIVLKAYETARAAFPELVLVLAPRHAERSQDLVALVDSMRLGPPFLRTSAENGEKRDGRKVVIVDRMGELFQIYSLASVVFMGGSLVPKGGQNILEPAAWGRPVLFGPSMEDFREARDILVRTGAGIEVRTGRDLSRRVIEALSNLERTSAVGARARTEVLKHAGSARRNAQALIELLESHGKAV